mmetsp:Transcript_47851/g.86304  ORF Transcript_47851/g.86304 Transcript_47851/m.86304 type:complete len:248 (+) Transcript_47851:43-786(+)|eukprot:CAMPEP_0197656354 /NCGR_PEP_ID=MMETSP1338-20131121/41483_1 /TAXON_ID=43686 ORGANISM="Pelagodinium beii, Strain RCC1491" /NCGR_SAMPLE_ID=MMETSP1338 /ASSEMBLY_ACC=CAM_ASM_000754 /LENGTH=247 /DNA_ID=CAMNT_0043232319 /DNA_START=43 /DNA_END=786 /DNA_ORIENTATION=+
MARSTAILRTAVALFALLAVRELNQVAFTAPSLSLQTGDFKETSRDLGRRQILGALSLSSVLPLSARAEEAPKPKKERPPDVLVVEGVSDPASWNGRWSIQLGAKKNGKAIYKKDGATLFLFYNDCDEYTIDADRKATGCEGLAGVKKASGWIVKGQPQPGMKVRPEGKAGESQVAGAAAAQRANIDALVAKEMAAMDTESNAENFRGTMAQEDELVGDRLMKKFGVDQGAIRGKTGSTAAAGKPAS